MKVVLKKDVPDLGEADNVINVADGHARNFLFPRRLAVLASKKELAAAEQRRAAREQQQEARRAEFQALAEKLSALELVLPVDAGEGGKLFGSVTTQDIALAIKEQAQVEVDKKKIELADHIKATGDYEAVLKIYKEISARLKIKVIAR